MHVSESSPRIPYQPRQRKSHAYDIVQQLRWNPEGVWFSVNLDELHGQSAKLKFTSTTRAIKRFYDVVTLVEDGRFYVKRIPDQPRRLPKPSPRVLSA